MKFIEKEEQFSLPVNLFIFPYQYRIYHDFPFLDQNKNPETSPKSVQMWPYNIYYKLSFTFFNE